VVGSKTYYKKKKYGARRKISKSYGKQKRNYASGVYGEYGGGRGQSRPAYRERTNYTYRRRPSYAEYNAIRNAGRAGHAIYRRFRAGDYNTKRKHLRWEGYRAIPISEREFEAGGPVGWYKEPAKRSFWSDVGSLATNTGGAFIAGGLTAAAANAGAYAIDNHSGDVWRGLKAASSGVFQPISRAPIGTYRPGGLA